MNEHLPDSPTMRIERDYFSRHYSYISDSRSKRPNDFSKAEDLSSHLPTCVFCPGNEDKTPPEIGRISDGKGGWSMRWFPNKFTAVSSQAPDAYGYQEVIAETPDPLKQLWDFDVQELATLISVYQERIRAFNEDLKIQSIVIFKNHGKEAGASLVHSHTQVIATSVPLTREKKSSASQGSEKSCLSCLSIDEERGSKRVIGENEHFFVFCPRAPRYAMEAWVTAKNHEKEFLAFSEDELRDLATLLSTLLRPLRTLSASYCFFITYRAHSSTQSHFQLELLPRLHVWGGFELASGDYIIGISPEKAAQFYRGQT